MYLCLSSTIYIDLIISKQPSKQRPVITEYLCAFIIVTMSEIGCGRRRRAVMKTDFITIYDLIYNTHTAVNLTQYSD